MLIKTQFLLNISKTQQHPFHVLNLSKRPTARSAGFSDSLVISVIPNQNLQFIRAFGTIQKYSNKTLRNVIPTLEQLLGISPDGFNVEPSAVSNFKVVGENFKKFSSCSSNIFFVNNDIIINCSDKDFESYQYRYLAVIPSHILPLLCKEKKRFRVLLKNNKKKYYNRDLPLFCQAINATTDLGAFYLFYPVSAKDVWLRLVITERLLGSLISHILTLATLPKYSGLVFILSYQTYRVFSLTQPDELYYIWSNRLTSICEFKSETLPLKDYVILFEFSLIKDFFQNNISLKKAKPFIMERFNEPQVTDLVVESSCCDKVEKDFGLESVTDSPMVTRSYSNLLVAKFSQRLRQMWKSWWKQPK